MDIVNISIKARSSSDEPYIVNFIIQDKKMAVTCDCPAGKWEKLCKHKVELISGDKDRLFNMGEQAKFEELNLIIANIPYFTSVAQDIATSEKKIKQEKKKLKKIKSDFEKKLKNGMDIV